MKLILTIAVCLLVFSNTLADSARVFDEYGDLPFSDERARLDNLAIQLKLEPNSVVWYYIFAGRKDCADEARLRAIRAKNYLVKKHGIQADRIRWIDQGYRENLLVELWVWPRNLSRPYGNNSSLDRNTVQVKKCKSKYLKQYRRN